MADAISNESTCKITERVRSSFPLPPVVGDEADDAELDKRHVFSTCTPRTALVLAVALEVMSDWIIDGSECDDETDRYTSDELPPIARNRTYEWMARLSNCFLDLRDDILASGHDPRPLCTGEEVALALAIDYARDTVNEGCFYEEGTEYGDALNSLSQHPEDFDWEMLEEVLFKDRDFEMLYDPKLDGIEDPECAANAFLGCINLHPDDWFKWFRWSPEDVREPRVSHRAVRDGAESECPAITYGAVPYVDEDGVTLYDIEDGADEASA